MAVAIRKPVVITLAVLAAAMLGVSGCKKAQESGASAPKETAKGRPGLGTIIADGEALGFNARLGEKFNQDRLIAELAKSRFKVDVAVKDASDNFVPGTVGDGTVYFWFSPDPRAPSLVGSLTVGVDLNTAMQVGKISRAQFEKLIKESRAEGDKRGGSAPNISKYSAAEALLAARRNPGVVSDAGVGLGSTKDEVLKAYGETKDQVFLSGDTVRIYRGPKVAVGMRFSDDVVRQIIVFPADYDYQKLNEDTQAMYEPPPTQPAPGANAKDGNSASGAQQGSIAGGASPRG
jgi:hypothetical protein